MERVSLFNWSGLPAPELWSGVRQVMEDNRTGHLAYFLGENGAEGWWSFFPVLLAVKTPLAFLVLFAAGLWMSFKPEGRALRTPALFAAAILGFSMSARINIGVRHVLPVYALMAMIAAAGASRLIERGRTRRWALTAAILLLAWQAASSASSHPDYLAYFNELAGGEPERIVVDSDLDWGQDIHRLGQRLRALGARSVAFTPSITASLASHGFPPHTPNDPFQPSPGWNAVAATYWKVHRMGLGKDNAGVPVWRDRFPPTERVGRSILLYYFDRGET